MNAPVSKIVIAGGGTAGWMAAAALSAALPRAVKIVLVESEEIGTVGVGEATIPPIVGFNETLGVREDEFLKATSGTFKLGIEFLGWGRKDTRYIHPFGTYGIDLRGIKFHQAYFAMKQAGHAVGPLDDYSLCATAAYANRFLRPEPKMGPVFATLKYAYHFDASLYAGYLRRLSEGRGVTRIEGRIVDVARDADTGHIAALTLDGERTVDGQLFIDCTGFRGLLIGEALGVPYRDWSRYLPCDRALAVPSVPNGPLTPYTRATADLAGWRWRIPLQHRVGNGHVYCSAFMDDDTARSHLVAGLDGEPLADPRPLRFTTGRRERFWEKNCIAMGLSSGFLEPLESTSIHLIQSAVSKLIALFPDTGWEAAERDEYNALLTKQYEQVRDFIIAHYKLTERDDTDFWRHCRDMAVPDSLAHKIALFAAKGRLIRHDEDLFAEDNWLAVLNGQGVVPRGHDPLIDALPADDVLANLGRIRAAIAQAAGAMPSHDAFIDRYGRAVPVTIPESVNK
ncbi:tryptophan halogenase family protein [Asticcacaulis solisilvae]|uniref:tryptophan halogenase family protein n=1 Tax=Asticcacaulis solisilvae TaxID=1217274 RepID=UPI003FD75F04